jgi:hypothetical protein
VNGWLGYVLANRLEQVLVPDAGHAVVRPCHATGCCDYDAENGEPAREGMFRSRLQRP